MMGLASTTSIEPQSLADLLTDHFDGLLAKIGRGWGPWLLDQVAEQCRCVLVHRDSGYSVAIDDEGDWLTIVASKEWSCASDIGELLYAMRDLEYARWLGVLPTASEDQ